MADEFTEVRLSRLENQIDRIHEAIVGNGEPGLKERVRHIERFVDSRIRIETAIGKTILGIVIAGTATAAVWLIKQIGA